MVRMPLKCNSTLGENWESTMGNLYQAATGTPATIRQPFLAVVDAQKLPASVSTPASVPINPAVAGCTLVPPFDISAIGFLNS